MSKSTILTAVRKNKPGGPAPLPDIPVFRETAADTVETFIAVSEAGASRVVRITDARDLNAVLKIRFPDRNTLASPLSEIAATLRPESVQSPLELEHMDVAVLKGRVGVAENGAIWVTEADCVHRVLPFICQHLVILLDRSAIVPDMHAAYERIRVDEEGFGLFISGPSKTADIEQALVIGAQGARSLTVFLINE